jgi:HD-GYP domain-containing protein (c-di-GMP phosphodiesterase class II)
MSPSPRPVPLRTHATATERSRLEELLALAAAADPRSVRGRSHSERVGDYAAGLAAALGFEPRACRRIHLAGRLHDVGKTAVPRAILEKEGPLTEEELREVKLHPLHGARMMDSGGLDDIRRWTLAHHERPDGRGYPFGLRASEIPVEARILAVTDAYEAMTADRPYRHALAHWQACHELARGAGTQFDALVVGVFLRSVSSEARARRIA